MVVAVVGVAVVMETARAAAEMANWAIEVEAEAVAAAMAEAAAVAVADGVAVTGWSQGGEGSRPRVGRRRRRLANLGRPSRQPSTSTRTTDATDCHGTFLRGLVTDFRASVTI